MIKRMRSRSRAVEKDKTQPKQRSKVLKEGEYAREIVRAAPCHANVIVIVNICIQDQAVVADPFITRQSSPFTPLHPSKHHGDSVPLPALWRVPPPAALADAWRPAAVQLRATNTADETRCVHDATCLVPRVRNSTGRAVCAAAGEARGVAGERRGHRVSFARG